MAFIDARELSGTHTRIESDICIVGAGAAGITLAAELAAASRDVCLIESGGFAPDENTQSLYDLESTGYPFRENYMSRARYFGGSCNLWAGRSMPLNALDFDEREWVPHSGWPLPYGEMAAFYPRAYEVLALPAQHDAQCVVQQRIADTERALFRSGTFAPTLSLWGRSAKRFGADYRGQLRRARSLRVHLNASITRIDLSPDGKQVESLSASTLEGKRFEVRAKQFVLACGGLENARLLLVSRDGQSQGVANSSGAVGRYFMDHPRAVYGKVHFEQSGKLPLLRGRPLAAGKLQVGLGLSPQAQRSAKLLNHYLTLEVQSSGYTEARYQSFVQTMQVALRKGYAGSRWSFAKSNLEQLPNMIYLLSPKELMPHPLYRAYVAARDAIPRKSVPRSFVVVYFCEQPPDPSSRVTLSEEKDRLGLNKLKLHWRIGPEVTESLQRMQALLAAELQSTGVGRLEAGEGEPKYTDASHHMGTTRMSTSPADGVVDTDCRAHGIDNLYIAGSSVFPCAGHANPTLTIVALALRLAGHLKGLKA